MFWGEDGFGAVLFYWIRDRMTEISYDVHTFASLPNTQLIAGPTSTVHLKQLRTAALKKLGGKKKCYFLWETKFEAVPGSLALGGSNVMWGRGLAPHSDMFFFMPQYFKAVSPAIICSYPSVKTLAFCQTNMGSGTY